MRFGSLFSGIGGFDLGFERAGMKCAWQCEIDTKCQEVLSKRFGVKIYNDVRTIDRNAESVDVICGGFPCQDLSIAGKRKGLAGERSGLWFEFARIIEELKPKWVVIENVPGLLSSNRGADFAVVISGLVKFGYGVSWRILDAQYFGVAQRRRRVFIVGSLGNGDSAKVLFESESLSRDPAEGRKTGKTVAGTIDAKSCSSNRGSQTNELDFIAYDISHRQEGTPRDCGDISPCMERRMGTGGNNVPIIANTLSGGSSKCHSDITSGQGDGNVIPVVLNDQGGSQMGITENITATLRTQEHGHQPIVLSSTQANAGIVSDGEPSLTSAHEQPIVCATSRTLRTGKEGGGKGYLGNENQAMTLRGQPQFVGVRRLTPTECARLQGFPVDWNDWQSDSNRYKQFGNAVCVNVAEWIGKKIMEVEHDEIR